MEKRNAWEYGFKKGWKVLQAKRGERRAEIIYVELEKVSDGEKKN